MPPPSLSSCRLIRYWKASTNAPRPCVWVQLLWHHGSSIAYVSLPLKCPEKYSFFWITNFFLSFNNEINLGSLNFLGTAGFWTMKRHTVEISSPVLSNYMADIAQRSRYSGYLCRLPSVESELWNNRVHMPNLFRNCKTLPAKSYSLSQLCTFFN